MKLSKCYYSFLILFFLFFSLIAATAQTVIKGKVIDALSRQPLEAVSVIVTGNPKEKALTDEHGIFY